MVDIDVRDALPADVPVVRDVFRAASWSNEGDRVLFAEHPEFLDWADDAVAEGRTRVASIDGLVVGFATYVAMDGRLEVEDLFVEPGAMRRGVARRLIDDLVAIGRDRGVAHLGVDANEHAVAFYRAVGFVPGDVVPLEHGTALRMALPV